MATDPPIRTRTHTPWREIWNAIVHEHRRRSFLGFVLMPTQAFFYNAIFFTYALVLMRFYGVPADKRGHLPAPVRARQCARAAVLGHLFEIGRKPMIPLTWSRRNLFAIDRLVLSRRNAHGTNADLAWTVIFFVASAAASSAYLTVSEIFPLEIRAFAIAIFYAIGTLAGGVVAPFIWLDHRHRIGKRALRWISGRRGLMIVGAIDRSLDRSGGGRTIARANRVAALESRQLIAVAGTESWQV